MDIVKKEYTSIDDIIKQFSDKFSITHENDISKLTEIFDVVRGDETNLIVDSIIKTKEPMIIIFDNEDFNETYLLDMYLEQASSEDFKSINKLKIVYVDKIETKKYFITKINEPLVTEGLDSIESNIFRKKYEETFTIPSLLVINTIDDEIYVISESRIAPISRDKILETIKELDKEFS